MSALPACSDEVAFADWSAAVAARVEIALARTLPDEELAPQRLHQAMRYAVLGAGKRVRPLLVHAAGQLCKAPVAALDSAVSFHKDVGLRRGVGLHKGIGHRHAGI